MRLSIVILISLILVGCGGNTTPSSPLVRHTTEANNQMPHLESDQTKAAQDSQPTFHNKPLQPTSAHILPATAAPNLMGLQLSTVKKILGNPNIERKELDSISLHYKNQECGLHLFFYHQENDYRLSHIDVTASDLFSKNPTVSKRACLNSHVK